jgi:hypothetical protein
LTSAAVKETVRIKTPKNLKTMNPRKLMKKLVKLDPHTPITMLVGVT